ncbi:hypothetical protein D3C72_2420860 [compost metagenome]
MYIALEFDPCRKLVFALVFQDGLGAADEGFPNRAEQPFVLALHILLPVEHINIAQQWLDIAGQSSLVG